MFEGIFVSHLPLRKIKYPLKSQHRPG